MKRVLITGMSGLIGGAVGRRLAGRYELTALNRRDVPGVRTVQADIADFDAIQPAFVGQEVVVHLSAVVRAEGPWQEILQSNVIGTYNVFEAARQAGVRRVIFASSGMAIGGYARQFPYNALLEGRYDEVPQPWPMLTHESLPYPASLYGVSKVSAARPLSGQRPDRPVRRASAAAQRLSTAGGPCARRQRVVCAGQPTTS